MIVKRDFTYTPKGAKTQYRLIAEAALETAKRASDGSWYIGAGSVYVNLDGYTVPKAQNITGTLPNVNLPFVDTHDHSVGDLGYRFIIGATLGNNGRITLKPDTGLALTKVMAEGVVAPTTPFSFTITNLSDAKDNRSYQAWIVSKDLENTPTTVAFSNGSAKVSLYADQTLYIGGMTPGTVYRVTEAQTANYLPETASFTVTLTQGKMEHVTFVNAPRGTGNLMISKEVIHDLGSSYTIPENKSFTIHVDLNGPDVENVTFKAIHSTGLISAVTTDENGSFEITLKHDQQLMVTGLPEGTMAKVTEPNPGAGFTASFQEKGKTGDGNVTIPSGIDDGQAVSLRGQGNAGKNGGPAGDLQIVVTVKPHQLFRRDGADVFCDAPITFTQAALGAEIEVPTIDGKVKFTIHEGTKVVITETIGDWCCIHVGNNIGWMQLAHLERI